MKIASLLVAVVLFNACGSNSSPTAPTPTAGTRIMALEGSLAFGDVQVGQTKELPIIIRNAGTATLTVGDLSGPASVLNQVTASVGARAVAPGGSTTLTIRFAPTTTGTVSGTITVNSDQTSGTNTLAFTGSGVAAPIIGAFTVAGVVTHDVTRAALAGIVVIVEAGPFAGKTSTTDGNGYYSIGGVGGGIILRSTGTGYTTSSRGVQVNADTRLDFTMQPAPPTVTPPSFAALAYQVSGTGAATSAGLTYANCTSGTSQQSDAQLPWTFTCPSIPTGQFVYISAQNNRNSGCVKVQIFKRGGLYRESESCGAFVIATASGSY